MARNGLGHRRDAARAGHRLGRDGRFRKELAAEVGYDVAEKTQSKFLMFPTGTAHRAPGLHPLRRVNPRLPHTPVLGPASQTAGPFVWRGTNGGDSASAKTFGITFPLSLLGRADEVME
jgi:hypothetical protein